MLRDLAIHEGVEIRQNANVVQADSNADSVSVRLETGDTIPGDIIVLADGCSSKLRSSVTGYFKLEAAPRVLFVAFSVDISFLKDDDSFRNVLEPTDVFPFIFMIYRILILH
jgi:flavin-dependent dehydrogenase